MSSTVESDGHRRSKSKTCRQRGKGGRYIERKHYKYGQKSSWGGICVVSHIPDIEEIEQRRPMNQDMDAVYHRMLWTAWMRTLIERGIGGRTFYGLQVCMPKMLNGRKNGTDW